MGRLTRSHLLWLLIAGVVCLLSFQGRRVLTEHEVFAAEPAREMLAGRGWLLQPFAGEYRTKKPPGQSWAIAASLAVTRSHSEWAARLPSALAGVGLAVIVAYLAAGTATTGGTGGGESRRGLIAGLMTLTCVGVQQRARLAEADMGLAFCVALANAMVFRSLSRYAGGGLARGAAEIKQSIDTPHTPQTPSLTLPRGYTGEGTSGLAVMFWLAVVAGFMLKGPIVLGFTVLPAAVAWAVLRFAVKDQVAATAVRRCAFWWPAVVGGVLLILAWPLAAGRAYPPAWAQWKHEIFDRVRGEVGHGDENRHDPLLAYVWLAAQSTLPWCVFAVFAVKAAWRVRAKPATVLLACWAVCGFGMISAIAFKVLHYALPAIAPILVLSAIGFDRVLVRWLRGRRRESRAIWERASVAGWFGVVAVGWLVVAGWVMPAKDWGVKVRDFAHRVEAAVPPGSTVYFYYTGDRTGEDHTAWYLDHPLRQAKTIPDERPAYLVCRDAELKALDRVAVYTLLVDAESVTKRGGSERNDRVLVRVDALR